MKNKIFAIMAVILAGSLIFASFFYIKQETVRSQIATLKEIESYVQDYYKIERYIIESYPIYSDWAGPEKESKLRKYLLKDHLAVVEQMNLKALENDSEIELSKQQNKLVSLAQNTDTPYYFYNVPAKYRFLQPVTAKGMLLIANRFNEILITKKKDRDLPDFSVKFAVSSAIRPVQYQNKLRKSNPNASYISSHSYGASFDIFYDTFFIARNQIQIKTLSNEPEAIKSLSNLRTRLGYTTGDALRRQLRAMLAETLIQLQDEGKLYAILERNQRCFHVTILP